VREKQIANSTRAHHFHVRRRANITQQLANSQTASVSRTGLALVEGARVLDLVTGTEGTITAGSLDHIVNAAGTTNRAHNFSVRLCDGSTVTRTKKQLAALPAGMVSALCLPPPAES
jgi:hypothetical protein